MTMKHHLAYIAVSSVPMPIISSSSCPKQPSIHENHGGKAHASILKLRPNPNSLFVFWKKPRFWLGLIALCFLLRLIKISSEYRPSMRNTGMNDDMILRDAREMNPTLHPRVHVDGIGKGDDPIATQMKTISVGLMNMNHSEKNVRQSRSDGLPSSSSSYDDKKEIRETRHGDLIHTDPSPHPWMAQSLLNKRGSSDEALKSFIQPFPLHVLPENMSESEKDFWKQPNSFGFKPCLEFSSDYLAESKKTAQAEEKQGKKYLLVIVSGGLNQQRNEIVDAVVIARILGAVLVIPILQVNQIWNDPSEFSDVFDVHHFKSVLKDHVSVVSSLPSTHIMTRPVQRSNTPLFATPQWFRRNYMKRLNRDGILLLRGLDGRLSKDLPPDLQKLRCKVAFHALRFTAPILEIGNLLSRRMWEKGPYVALHLRLEKDVWVRTGCLPGLNSSFDKEIHHARQENPRFLTARNQMNYTERKVAGLCPLNAAEVARLLEGLGATKNTNVFWAGGEPLGGEAALRPLINKFGHLYNKEMLALPGELDPFLGKASCLAAIDYLISLHSDVFMPSHGGNMARALQGHRAYAGFRKHITPNKREMLPYFLNNSLITDGEEVDLIIRKLHKDSWGQPSFRTRRVGRDVLAYPAPECMCDSNPNTNQHLSK